MNRGADAGAPQPDLKLVLAQCPEHLTLGPGLALTYLWPPYMAVLRLAPGSLLLFFLLRLPRSPPARRHWGRRDRPLATLLGQDEPQLHPAFPQQPHISVDEPRAYALPSTPPRMLHPAAHPPHQNPFMVDLHDQVGAAAPSTHPKGGSLVALGCFLVVLRHVPQSPLASCLLLGALHPEAASALLQALKPLGPLDILDVFRVFLVPRGWRESLHKGVHVTTVVIACGSSTELEAVLAYLQGAKRGPQPTSPPAFTQPPSFDCTCEMEVLGGCVLVPVLTTLLSPCQDTARAVS